jgi:hypothetical protein
MAPIIKQKADHGGFRTSEIPRQALTVKLRKASHVNSGFVGSFIIGFVGAILFLFTREYPKRGEPRQMDAGARSTVLRQAGTLDRVYDSYTTSHRVIRRIALAHYFLSIAARSGRQRLGQSARPLLAATIKITTSFGEAGPQKLACSISCTRPIASMGSTSNRLSLGTIFYRALRDAPSPPLQRVLLHVLRGP